MKTEYSKEALRFLEYLCQQGKTIVSHSMLPAEIEKPDIDLLHVMARKGHIKIIRQTGNNYSYRIKDAGISHIEQWREDQIKKQKSDKQTNEALETSKEANQIALMANMISEESNKIAKRASRYSLPTFVVSLLALAVSIAGFLLSFFRR